MGPLAYPGAVGVVRDVTCSHGSSQHQPMQPPASTARRLQTNLLPLGAGPLRGPGCWPVRIPREKLAKFGKLLGGSRQVSGPLVGCTLLLGSQAGAAVARLGATSCGGQGPRGQLSPAVSPHLAGHLSAQGTVNLPSHQQHTTHPL